MNTKLDTINIEDVLFWDMETVTETEELEVDSLAYDVFRVKNRNKETNELPSELETLQLYKKKGALSTTHSKIACLSMGFVKDNVIYLKSLVGEQKDIISEFSKVLNKGYIPCGWNIIKFDFPMLRIKAWQEGIVDYAPEQFNDAGKKEWAMSEIKYKTNMIDLMLHYQGTHYIPSSLAEACYVLGVDTPKDDIDGSQVSEVFYSEGVDRISKYCEKDVVACINLFQKMRGLTPITKISSKNTETKKDLNSLQKLVRDNYLSDEIKKEIKNKKFSKKDRKYLEDLLISSYVKSTFSTEDSTATDDDDTKEGKINEIQEFLDECFR